jgi:hypothetical protein
VRRVFRHLLFCFLFLAAGLPELCASIPKTRVGNFFAPSFDSPPETSLQVPELRLENWVLYDESASGRLFWSKFDPEGLAEETFDNGTEIVRDGQHVSPVQSWKDPKGNVRFSKDVTDQLNDVRIKPETGDVVHGWSKAHDTYNQRAEAITARYVEEAKKAGLDPSGMSGKQAKEFADGLVKELQEDKYINRFNEMVRQGKGTAAELNVMREAALAEGIAAETGVLAKAGKLSKLGTFFKHLGTVGAVASALGFAADAHANGAEKATKNAIKSATFYDVTVEPAGEAYNKLYEKAQQGRLNGESVIGNYLNERQRLLNPTDE